MCADGILLNKYGYYLDNYIYISAIKKEKNFNEIYAHNISYEIHLVWQINKFTKIKIDSGIQNNHGIIFVFLFYDQAIYDAFDVASVLYVDIQIKKRFKA